MAAPAPVDPVRIVHEPPRAGLLLKPLRRRILAAARTPASATAIAATLGLSRQRVNYHVRQLAHAGFLRRAGRQQRRGLVEQKYVVTARAFLIAPAVVGEIAAASEAGNTLSAAYLLTLAGRIQQEVGRGWRDAEAAGKRLPVLALDTEISFATPAARARFAEALTAAITRVIAEHASPAAGAARSYRLAVGCYPKPSQPERGAS